MIERKGDVSYVGQVNSAATVNKRTVVVIYSVLVEYDG